MPFLLARELLNIVNGGSDLVVSGTLVIVWFCTLSAFLLLAADQNGLEMELTQALWPNWVGGLILDLFCSNGGVYFICTLWLFWVSYFIQFFCSLSLYSSSWRLAKRFGILCLIFSVKILVTGN